MQKFLSSRELEKSIQKPQHGMLCIIKIHYKNTLLLLLHVIGMGQANIKFGIARVCLESKGKATFLEKEKSQVSNADPYLKSQDKKGA